ncbi:3-oxoacyl-[acyl-carrier-protein] synthase [Renibacterium salmoninarum ATCC 33209]|uniref:3-oxoacyl-[acyl-carrier-protein] synthase n=1 Tax=Renibacterium salmoninarum (strain ATCC 33209 / DSM 20767 / JCM 11484 / NBRC 15589 / NCIMB 2235) TaxID=288705 RepID=A9WUE3_RENSM|nr:3-oxoacyl-ACP synthase [Renibacterium salmoninarum]ABY24814.1 3-oxoacyl-[acyl-carrier-protein] synthase [Renibacterium salmoninarum ATCC 33209]
MAEEVIPPTTNITEVDPEISLDIVTTLRPHRSAHAVVNAFGFGGHNATVVLSLN